MIYYAESGADLLTLAQTLDMTGLEFMTGILEGRHPAPPIGRTLNYRLHATSDGEITFRGAPLFDHCNPLGTVHGGWYGTLLDSAMACAVMTRLPKGRVYTTLEYKINILRPIPLEMQVDCHGNAHHVGRSTGVASGEIRGVEDGKLYATGSTTCIVMTP
ncbi:MAG: PaaI family thioesterase [Pseudomonadota bacterium]